MNTHGALRAGDATFHAGWTIHGAAGNPSTTMRSVMTIIYFADGVRVARATDFQRGDLKYWLADLPAGRTRERPEESVGLVTQ